MMLYLNDFNIKPEVNYNEGHINELSFDIGTFNIKIPTIINMIPKY